MNAPTSGRPGDRRGTGGLHGAGASRLGLAAVATAMLAWAPALLGDFQFDDLPNIVLDPATTGAEALRARLADGFRPLLRLSYFVDHRLWGFAAIGFLLTNILLHAAAVWLVWRLAERRLADLRAAFAAALVFALQPANGAAVAWASGRSTLLSTVLLLAALLTHERWRDAGRRTAADGARAPGRAWLAASLVLTLAAVAAKEVALAAPLLLLVWEATRAPAPGLREIAARVAPVLLVCLAAAAAGWAFVPRWHALASFSFALAPPLEALALHLSTLPVSLSLWIRPFALAVEHRLPSPPVPALWGATLLALLVLAALALRRRRPVVSLAILWPLAALAPSHSLVARLDPIVEKALYPAWFGPALAAGLAAATFTAPQQRAAVARAIAVLSLGAALFGASFWRAGVWADPLALWREATLRAPESARAWHNRAVAQASAGAWCPARVSVTRALALDPGRESSRDLADLITLFGAGAAQGARFQDCPSGEQ